MGRSSLRSPLRIDGVGRGEQSEVSLSREVARYGKKLQSYNWYADMRY